MIIWKTYSSVHSSRLYGLFHDIILNESALLGNATRCASPYIRQSHLHCAVSSQYHRWGEIWATLMIDWSDDFIFSWILIVLSFVVLFCFFFQLWLTPHWMTLAGRIPNGGCISVLCSIIVCSTEQWCMKIPLFFQCCNWKSWTSRKCTYTQHLSFWLCYIWR